MISNKRIKPSRPGVVATVVLGGVVVGGVVVGGCVLAGGAAVDGAGVGTVVVGGCVVTGGAVVAGAAVVGAAVLGFVDAAEDNKRHENVCRLTLHRGAASADLRTENRQAMHASYENGTNLADGKLSNIPY